MPLRRAHPSQRNKASVEAQVVAFFALFLISIIIIRNHSTGDWTAPWIVISLMTGLLLPLFAGMMFTFYAGFSRQRLLIYKKDIRVYRARQVATRVINLIQEDKIVVVTTQGENENTELEMVEDYRLLQRHRSSLSCCKGRSTLLGATIQLKKSLKMI
jgi:uncharacterized integral membrane protein